MRFPCLHRRPDILPDTDVLIAADVPHTPYLAADAQGIWQLHTAGRKPQHIDFADSFYRCRGGTEYLPKTFKSVPAGGRILDATAGWGRDSWLLAYRGFRVTLCERHPALYALLAQALASAASNPLISAAAARLSLCYGDALDTIAARGREYDAIYLDPMFPAREKSAKVKKDMQTLHELLADSENNGDALLTASLASGCPRIVVKRPKGAPYLADTAPHHSLQTPNIRYDIYL